MTLTQREYTLRMLSPAFLGNAAQSGQWRTPPFKAQLRQWWRVAYAASKNFQLDVKAMREAEGMLFGHAWLEGDRDERGNKTAARKSRVRIRLGQWGEGKLPSWAGPDITVVHKEVARPVGSQLYLGFGPLVSRGSTALKANAAIQAGEHSTLSLAYPEGHAALVEQALWLMDQFGTVGGRSRNAWGSYGLIPNDGKSIPPAALPLRDWQKCLQLDWPHAIGQDDGVPLIWQTQPHADWQLLMKELAVLKIGLRTKFGFPNAKPDGQLHDRHWLSYPITRHSVKAWGNNLRLPNSLRFKLRPSADGKLVGVIFHMPCLPPPAFQPDMAAIKRVWQGVHSFLDQQAHLSRAKV